MSSSSSSTSTGKSKNTASSSYLSSKVKSKTQNPRGAVALFNSFDSFKTNPATVLPVHLTYAFNSAGVTGDNLDNPFTGHFDSLHSNASIKKTDGKDAEDSAKSETQLFTSPGMIDQGQIDLGNKISSPMVRPLAIGNRKKIEGSGGAGRIAAAPTYQCRTTICKNDRITSPYPFKWEKANKGSSGFKQGNIREWQDKDMVWGMRVNEIEPAIDPRNYKQGEAGTKEYLRASREWKLRYSWCLGLPLEWGIENYNSRANTRDAGAIDCEHKLPLSWQVLFGCGPATVLSWYKENPDVPAGEATSGYGSNLDTVKHLGSASRNDEFLRVKYAVREECYAWELAKMNREYKNQVVFINIVVDGNRIKYVIARNAIARMINAMCNNKFSFDEQEGRIHEWERIIINIMKANGITTPANLGKKIQSVRRNIYKLPPRAQVEGGGRILGQAQWRQNLNNLLKFAFDYENGWGGVPDRLRNEGIIGVIDAFLSDGQKSRIGGRYNRMFIYKNIITQLLRLVALLNYNVNEVCRNMAPAASSSSLPEDIGIRYNLFLNYERIKRYVINKIAKKDTTYLDWVTKNTQSMLKICDGTREIQLEKESIGSDGKASYNYTAAATTDALLQARLNTNAIFLNDSKDLLKTLYNFGPQANTTQSNDSLIFLENLRNKNDIYQELNVRDGDFEQIGGYLEKRNIKAGDAGSAGSGVSSGDGGESKANNNPVFLPDGFWADNNNAFAFYAADIVDPTGYEGGSELSSSWSSSEASSYESTRNEGASTDQNKRKKRKKRQSASLYKQVLRKGMWRNTLRPTWVGPIQGAAAGGGVAVAHSSSPDRGYFGDASQSPMSSPQHTQSSSSQSSRGEGTSSIGKKYLKAKKDAERDDKKARESIMRAAQFGYRSGIKTEGFYGSAGEFAQFPIFTGGITNQKGVNKGLEMRKAVGLDAEQFAQGAEADLDWRWNLPKGKIELVCNNCGNSNEYNFYQPEGDEEWWCKKCNSPDDVRENLVKPDYSVHPDLPNVANQLTDWGVWDPPPGWSSSSSMGGMGGSSSSSSSSGMGVSSSSSISGSSGRRSAQRAAQDQLEQAQLEAVLAASLTEHNKYGSSSSSSRGGTKKKRRRKKRTRRRRKYHKKTRKRRRKKGLITHRKRN